MIPKNDPILETELILVHIDHKPAFYGRVEQITADVKPKWWRVKFLFLTLPMQVATWIIDEQQIRGAEFTMGGTPVSIEKVVPPEEPEEAPVAEQEPQKQEPKRKARVLSLSDRQNRDKNE